MEAAKLFEQQTADFNSKILLFIAPALMLSLGCTIQTQQEASAWLRNLVLSSDQQKAEPKATKTSAAKVLFTSCKCLFFKKNDTTRWVIQKLTLGKLKQLACFSTPKLLPFDNARVSSSQAMVLVSALHLRIQS
ncbi:MAG: hypothetical protein P3M74_00205 [Candidatus Hodgkinia cicadicola]|nr:MAG: hypothetical protein P3M74_00205 [Candidatus Hodgkinia cicadicola]